MLCDVAEARGVVCKMKSVLDYPGEWRHRCNLFHIPDFLHSAGDDVGSLEATGANP